MKFYLCILMFIVFCTCCTNREDEREVKLEKIIDKPRIFKPEDAIKFVALGSFNPNDFNPWLNGRCLMGDNFVGTSEIVSLDEKSFFVGLNIFGNYAARTYANPGEFMQWELGRKRIKQLMFASCLKTELTGLASVEDRQLVEAGLKNKWITPYEFILFLFAIDQAKEIQATNYSQIQDLEKGRSVDDVFDRKKLMSGKEPEVFRELSILKIKNIRFESEDIHQLVKPTITKIIEELEKS